MTSTLAASFANIAAGIAEVEAERASLKRELTAATDPRDISYLTAEIHGRGRAIGDLLRLRENLMNPPTFHQTVVGVLLE